MLVRPLQRNLGGGGRINIIDFEIILETHTRNKLKKPHIGAVSLHKQ